MANNPELFVVMIDYGKIGREAVVDPNHNWSDALDLVREAMGDGHTVCYVRHIHDGVDEDRSQEAYDTIMTELADNGEPLSWTQFNWIKLHCGTVAANAFQRAA